MLSYKIGAFYNLLSEKDRGGLDGRNGRWLFMGSFDYKVLGDFMSIVMGRICLSVWGWFWLLCVLFDE